MRLTSTLLGILLAVWALPAGAAGLESDKSLAELRRDAYRSEEAFYKLFNQLNEDSEYDVRCYYERPTGTRIKMHICRAKFITKAQSRHAARNMNNVREVADQSVETELAEKSAIFQQKIETLVAENPELQAALEEYNLAVARFQAKQKGN